MTLRYRTNAHRDLCMAEYYASMERPAKMRRFISYTAKFGSPSRCMWLFFLFAASQFYARRFRSRDYLDENTSKDNRQDIALLAYKNLVQVSSTEHMILSWHTARLEFISPRIVTSGQISHPRPTTCCTCFENFVFEPDPVVHKSDSIQQLHVGDYFIIYA